MRGVRIYGAAAIVLAAALPGLSSAGNPAVAPGGKSREIRPAPLLRNSDVIGMVQSGLPTPFILARIRRSSVWFDTSQRDLDELIAHGVPEEILFLMMTRPQDSAPLPESEAAGAQPLVIPVGIGPATGEPARAPLERIRQVLVRAPSDALRARAERTLGDMNGPEASHSDAGYDGVLVIGVDCASTTGSDHAVALDTTCRGSAALLSHGERMWSTQSPERSADSAAWSSRIVDDVTRDFVRSWKAARRRT
jgi:hypothetical protein